MGRGVAFVGVSHRKVCLWKVERKEKMVRMRRWKRKVVYWEFPGVSLVDDIFDGCERVER